MKKRFLNLGFSALVLTVFIVPLSFAILLPDINVFELDKLLALRLGVFFSLLFLVLSKKELTVGKRFLAPAIFLLAGLIISILAFNPIYSFWGSYFRQLGFFTQLSFVTFAFLVWAYREQNNFVPKLLTALFFSATLSAVYGLLQYINIDIFTWAEPAYLTGRVTSTMGQANYLGSFLLLSIFSGAYLLYLNRFSKWYRIVYFLGLLLQIIVLFMTASRGAILGLLGGCLILLLAHIKKVSKKFLLALGLVFILGVVGLFSLSDRLASVTDFSSGSVALRLQFWGDVVKNYQDKPLFGWGFNTSQEFFARHYDPQGALFALVNSLNDKAHNFIMDWYLDGGLVLLLAGLYLLYSVFRRWKAEPLSIYLAAALGAYLISLLFSFEFITGAMVFWLFVALILSQGEKATEFRFRKIFVYILLGATLILMLRSVWDKYSDVCAYKMRQALDNKEYYLAGNYYLKANYGRSAISKYDFIITETLLPQTDPFIDKMSALWQRGVALNNPRDVYSRINTGQAQVLLDDKMGAYGSFYALSQDFPAWPVVWEYYAKAAILAGDYLGAIDSVNRGLSLLPMASDERLNLEHRNSIIAYRSNLLNIKAEAYLRQGSYDLAITSYQEALDQDLDLSFYKKIADAYILQGNILQARYYLSRAMVLSPDNYAWPYALALSYKMTGDDKMFAEYLDKALVLDPTNPELNNWKNNIK